MQPTGIPKDVNLMLRVRYLEQALEHIVPAIVEKIESNRHLTTRDIIAIIEERCAGAMFSHDEDWGSCSMQRTMERLPMYDAVNRLLQRLEQTQSEPPTSQQQQQSQLYLHDGHFLRLPAKFVLAFHYWMQGDSSQGWPPLRSIEHRDIADSKQRHAFTEYLFLMKKLEKRVDGDAGVWYPQPTNEQTDAMFDIASLCQQQVPKVVSEHVT